jgi:uncharacterized protein
MAANAINWFEIYVQDMDRAKRFYESMLQVTLTNLNSATPEMWAFPHSPTDHGASGALVRMEGVDSGGNSTILYFHTADCAVGVSRATEAGGRVMKEKFSIGPYGFVALVFDTEGNLIGLHSMQ